VNRDDFLIASSSQTKIDALYKSLSRKYKFKLLGFSSEYLRCSVYKLPNGSVHISQLTAIKAVFDKASLQFCHGNPSHYLDK